MFFYIKLVLSFIINSICTYSIICMLKEYGLNEYISIILGLFAFVQVQGFSKSTSEIINTFLSEYQMSSPYYTVFFRKTIIMPVCAELVFKLPFLIPLIIISTIISANSLFFIIISIFLGLFMQAQQMIKELTKHIEGKLTQCLAFFKFICTASLLVFVFNSLVKIAQTFLEILNVVIKTKNYNEYILLQRLLTSVLDVFSWLQSFFSEYGVIILVIIGIFVVLSVLNNLIQYKSVWEAKFLHEKKCALKQQFLKNDKAINLPFIKMLKIAGLEKTYLQVKKQPEIIVFMMVEVIILNHVTSQIHKMFFILWFYFIGNANYLRSMLINGVHSFSNYKNCLDLYYWKLSGKSILTLYRQKLDVLIWSSTSISIIQILFSIGLCFYFINDITSVIGCTGLMIVIHKNMHKFNAKHASFASFFVFSNRCKAGLELRESDEDTSIEEKLYSLYKSVFTILPMGLLVSDYIFSFMSYVGFTVILFIFIGFAWGINIQLNQYIQKGGEVLEKINIVD